MFVVLYMCTNLDSGGNLTELPDMQWQFCLVIKRLLLMLFLVVRLRVPMMLVLHE